MIWTQSSVEFNTALEYLKNLSVMESYICHLPSSLIRWPNNPPIISIQKNCWLYCDLRLIEKSQLLFSTKESLILSFYASVCLHCYPPQKRFFWPWLKAALICDYKHNYSQGSLTTCLVFNKIKVVVFPLVPMTSWDVCLDRFIANSYQ